jgi:hypothetical protein
MMSRSAGLYLDLESVLLYTKRGHCSIPQQLLNEIHVGEHHAPAAVAIETQRIHGITSKSSVSAAIHDHPVPIMRVFPSWRFV